MLRMLLAGAIAAALTTAPGIAQEIAQDRHQRPLAGAYAVIVGLPVFTSDGRQIGKVTGVARDQGEPVLIAEIERPLGIGPQTVAIPIDMFVQRADRIELTLSAEQVADKLAGPEPER